MSGRPLARVEGLGARALRAAPTEGDPEARALRPAPLRPTDPDPTWWIVRLDRNALGPESASLRRRLVAAAR
jgi:hypothetical protein